MAVGHGDDMWALGLLMAELATGRRCGDRTGKEPVSFRGDLLRAIAAEVAGALGGSSQLFLLFACLLHRDPALRLTARQMQLWLQDDAAPQGVRHNRALLDAVRASPAAARCRNGAAAAVDAQLLGCLKRHRLEKFAAPLAAEGYECVADLTGGADVADFDDSFLASLGMGRAHMRRFREMLAGITSM